MIHHQPYTQHATLQGMQIREREKIFQAPLRYDMLTGQRWCYTSWQPDPEVWSYSIVYCLVQSTITGRKRPQHLNSKKSIMFLIHPWLKPEQNKNVSKQHHSLSKTRCFLSTYKFNSSPFKFLTIENQFCYQLSQCLLMSKFWNKKQLPDLQMFDPWTQPRH